jgi:hypothetical protein
MAEASILKRIVAAFTNEPHEVERLNQIDRGWPAAVPLGGGKIQIQRFKASTDTGNQKFLWHTFQAPIHEYAHTLAHADYNAYADDFGRNSMEWNTLIEVVNSLLTEIVWSNVNISELRQEIEGQRLMPLPRATSGIGEDCPQAADYRRSRIETLCAVRPKARVCSVKGVHPTG